MSREFLHHRALVLTAVLALPACDHVIGSGHFLEERREVPAFHRVEVCSGLHATVEQGRHSVIVRGDDNIVPHVATEVRDGVLHVSPDATYDEVVPLRIFAGTPVLLGASIEAGGAPASIDRPGSGRYDRR